MIRKNDTLVVPGFGMMEGDFHFYVDRVRPFRVRVGAGFLTGWHRRRDFTRTGPREWTHKDLLRGEGGERG